MLQLPFLTPENVLLWVGFWSLVGAALMGLDKVRAMGHSERISERTLQLVALAGGILGIVLGGVVFHHKTSKPSFWLPVAGSVVVWTIFLALLVQYGVLRLSY